MPVIATVLSLRRYSPSEAVLRKLEASGGTSFTTKPAAKTLRDSTSSGWP